MDVPNYNAWVKDSFSLPATGTGALSGLSFAVKDLFSIAGHISSFGNARWRSTHVAAERTAPSVASLLEAGAEMMGLTKLDQLAFSLVGDVGEGSAPQNPHYPERFTGGSSSGSAAAVAGSLVDFALGTDTAGSVRIPAACCGIAGIRPTHDLISSQGVLPLAPSFDVVGLLAKDLQILHRAFTCLGPKQGSPMSVNQILVADEGVNKEDGKVLAQAAARLGEELQVPVSRVDPAEIFNAPVTELFERIRGREIWNTHSEWAKKHSDALAPGVAARLKNCEKLADVSRAEASKDEELRGQYRDKLASILGGEALLLLPIQPFSGPNRDWTEVQLAQYRYSAIELTAPSCLTGFPQLVFPSAPNAQQVPISLLAPPGFDSSLLELAAKVFDSLP
ncbi:MAG: amidase family protein [Pseudomonadota bacterium]